MTRPTLVTSNFGSMDVRSRAASSPPPLHAANGKKNSIKQTIVFALIIAMLLSIVLWDMQKAQEISEVIHDDHTSLWRRMNDSAAKQWLSPLDLCLLNGVRDAGVDVKAFRAKNCSKALQQSVTSSGGASSSIFPLSQRQLCSIGASLGKVCPAPLYSRSFFQYQLKHPHYADHSNAQLSQALRTLAARNMPLIFIGDGLSKQNQDALVCALLRTDKVSIMSGTNPGSGTRNPEDYSFFTDYTIRWKDDKKLKLEVKYFKVFHIDDDPMAGEKTDENSNLFDFEFNFDFFGSSKSKKERRHEESRQRRRRTTTVPTSSPHSSLRSGGRRLSTNATQQSSQSPPLNVKLNTSRPLSKVSNVLTNSSAIRTNSSSSNTIVLPRYSFQQIKHVIGDLIASSNRSVAIVANAGVWYNSREQFRRELPTLLSWLEDLGKDEAFRHLIFYRETAAQHWNHTDNGYYDRDYQEKESNNGTCVPIENNTPELDWRNVDVYNAIANEGYQHIKIIPFHEITTPLFNMHPNSVQSQDCTHFCYFPQMWQPVWYEIYNATVHR